MKIFVLALAVLACGAYAGPLADLSYDGPECQAPNGGGLTPVLKEFVDILPLEDLAMIYLTAVSSDPEVQKVMEFIESEKFHKIIYAVQAAPEFSGLMDYACKELYLDAYYYYNKVADILGLPPINRPLFAELTEVLRARPGLVGMLEDMLDIMPLDKIKQLFKEKSENDEYAKKGLELLKSEDFKKMVKLVENLNEFQDMLTELRGMGVEVDKIIDTLKKFFGWD